MVRFANTCGPQLEWNRIFRQCEELRRGQFAAALLQIGREYLALDSEMACLPEFWRELRVGESPLLQDMLATGIYGIATMNRRHSIRPFTQ